MARSLLTEVGKRTSEAEQLLSEMVLARVAAVAAWAGAAPRRTPVAAATAAAPRASARRTRMKDPFCSGGGRPGSGPPPVGRRRVTGRRHAYAEQVVRTLTPVLINVNAGEIGARGHRTPLPAVVARPAVVTQSAVVDEPAVVAPAEKKPGRLGENCHDLGTTSFRAGACRSNVLVGNLCKVVGKVVLHQVGEWTDAELPRLNL